MVVGAGEVYADVPFGWSWLGFFDFGFWLGV